MYYKKIEELTIWLVVAVGLAVTSVAVAATTAKQTLEPGTIFKFKNKPAIYYVALDKKAYVYPDEATYFSWNPSFEKVKVYEQNQIANSITKAVVTLKPGTRVVKFGTDPKLFAIDRGARLRWIKNEEILVGVFSSSWKNYFVELPVNRKIDYIVGTDVTSTEAFNRNAIRTNFTVSDDLYVRKVLTVKIDKSKLPTTSVVALKTLTENLKGSFKPTFNPAIRYYTLEADYTEDRVILKPQAYEGGFTVKVRDYIVPDKGEITLDIPVGETDVPLTVSATDGRQQKYSIKLKRKAASEDTTLASLTENLSDSLHPKFSPGTRDYTIDASPKELLVSVNAKVANSRSRLIIDGSEVGSGAKYEKGLELGATVVQFVVVSESGKSDRYTISIRKLN